MPLCLKQEEITMRNTSLTTVLLLLPLLIFSGCKDAKTQVPYGEYFLSGDPAAPCINIINSTHLKLDNFNIDNNLINELMHLYDDCVSTDLLLQDLQKTIIYTTEKDGNRILVYANVTSSSGLTMRFDPAKNEFEVFDELYIKIG